MANEQMEQHWTAGAAGWVANEATFDAVFAPLTAALLDTAAIEPGNRVLDVGCGTGSLLAAATDAGADAVGIDISPGMVAAAQRRVPAATVLSGDAQVTDLAVAAPGAPFDRVVSRFGVMFFADPAAAFANIRRAAAPRARMVFLCWRGLDENLMFSLGTSVLVAARQQQPERPEPGAPGPTAFADGARLRAVLGDAGWDALRVDALDAEINYGFDGSDGIEARVATILGTTTGRLAREELEPRLGASGWAALVDDVRAELRSRLVDGAVRFNAATWLVTATNPG